MIETNSLYRLIYVCAHVLGLFIVKNTLLQAIATHLKQGKTLRDSVQKWTEEGKLRRAIEPNYQYNQDLKALRDQDSILTNMIEFQAEIITFTKITELSPNHYLCVLLPYKIFNILHTHTHNFVMMCTYTYKIFTMPPVTLHMIMSNFLCKVGPMDIALTPQVIKEQLGKSKEALRGALQRKATLQPMLKKIRAIEDEE